MICRNRLTEMCDDHHLEFRRLGRGCINGLVVCDRNEAAGLVGLSPVTLTNYTRVGYSALVRGLDSFVRYWQRGPYHRRKLFFTERGRQGLELRADRVFRPGPLSPSQRAFLKNMDATVQLPMKASRHGR